MQLTPIIDGDKDTFRELQKGLISNEIDHLVSIDENSFLLYERRGDNIFVSTSETISQGVTYDFDNNVIRHHFNEENKTYFYGQIIDNREVIRNISIPNLGYQYHLGTEYNSSYEFPFSLIKGWSPDKHLNLSLKTISKDKTIPVLDNKWAFCTLRSIQSLISLDSLFDIKRQFKKARDIGSVAGHGNVLLVDEYNSSTSGRDSSNSVILPISSIPGYMPNITNNRFIIRKAKLHSDGTMQVITSGRAYVTCIVVPVEVHPDIVEAANKHSADTSSIDRGVIDTMRPVTWIL